MIIVVILELIHVSKPGCTKGLYLLDPELTQAPPGYVVMHNNLMNRVRN